MFTKYFLIKYLEWCGRKKSHVKKLNQKNGVVWQGSSA